MRFPAIGYEGGFSSWGDALDACSGYQSEAIIQRVIASSRQVLAGEAAFERDGVAFHHPEYPYHLIAAMLSAALREGKRLSVLDFGGSLGSTYHQCRHVLSGLPELCWNVVEQPRFVEAGMQAFTTNELRFYFHIEDIEDGRKPNVALFSSVLQYLPFPEKILEQVCAENGITDILIDRTPFWRGGERRILVQRVPESIYPASYPLWVFSYERFVEALPPEWRVFDERRSPEGGVVSRDGLEFEYRNLWLRRVI